MFSTRCARHNKRQFSPAGPTCPRKPLASRTIHWLSCLSFVATALLLSVAGFSQTTGSSSISGVVTDPTGAVVPGATVEIHNPVSQFNRSTTTDSAGQFSFPNIPFNPYHVTVTAKGFSAYSQDVDVKSAVPLSLKIAVQIAGSAQSVDVQAEASDILENDPTFHTDLDRSLFEKPFVRQPRDADFLTLLLALFVVLFASSQLDKKKALQVSYAVSEALEKGGSPDPHVTPLPAPTAVPEPKVVVSELTASLNYLRQVLAQEIGAGKVEVHLDPGGLVISLRQAAYFPSGGDEIATSGLDSLEKISRTIHDLPNPVQLEGHTDSAPIHTRRFRSNWDLSAARSIAMLHLFEDRYNIAGSRLAVGGYAETKPVDSNDSAEGRAHNRRVDIVILNR